MQGQQASAHACIIPVLVLLDLLRLQVSAAVEFYNQAFIDQAVHLSHTGHIHVHTDSEACPREMCVGQHL
ncbi:hypothetical protein GCM10010052_06720 [Paenarthrobacter histidinolovorans]|nr:hypothetical protein GCM10010052_06720 [Paenarthrobacter histidinolovorans]